MALPSEAFQENIPEMKTIRDDEATANLHSMSNGLTQSLSQCGSSQSVELKFLVVILEIKTA